MICNKHQIQVNISNASKYFVIIKKRSINSICIKDNLILMEFHGDGYLLRKKQFQLKNETQRNINEAQWGLWDHTHFHFLEVILPLNNICRWCHGYCSLLRWIKWVPCIPEDLLVKNNLFPCSSHVVFVLMNPICEKRPCFFKVFYSTKHTLQKSRKRL